MRSPLVLVLLLLLAIVGGGVAFWLASSAAPPQASETGALAGTARAIDGDTIDVQPDCVSQMARHERQTGLSAACERQQAGAADAALVSAWPA